MYTHCNLSLNIELGIRSRAPLRIYRPPKSAQDCQPAILLPIHFLSVEVQRVGNTFHFHARDQNLRKYTSARTVGCKASYRLSLGRATKSFLLFVRFSTISTVMAAIEKTVTDHHDSDNETVAAFNEAADQLRSSFDALKVRSILIVISSGAS